MKDQNFGLDPCSHETHTAVKLTLPFPEVFTLNLHWEANPKPTDILRLLTSIPETLAIESIYQCMSDDEEKESEYAFRGMIVYQGAHYYAFFRRILIKYDFQEINFRHQRTDLKELDGEIKPKTEWTCFNDESVNSVPGNWHGIIQQCIELSCFPSVLFFEKLDPEEDYERSKNFKMSSLELD